MERNVASQKREVRIDSNWIETTVMALVLLLCGWQLIREGRHLVFDRLTGTVLLTQFIDKVCTALLVACCFLGVFLPWPRSVKLGGLLLGTDIAVRVALHYFDASTTVQYSAAVAGSIARQVALVLFIFAIVQWFKSKIHRISPSNNEVVDA
jgi:hypothetical protein